MSPKMKSALVGAVSLPAVIIGLVAAMVAPGFVAAWLYGPTAGAITQTIWCVVLLIGLGACAGYVQERDR